MTFPVFVHVEGATPNAQITVALFDGPTPVANTTFPASSTGEGAGALSIALAAPGVHILAANVDDGGATVFPPGVAAVTIT